MTVNKVVYGGATLIDLTNDTVTEDVIIEVLVHLGKHVFRLTLQK